MRARRGSRLGAALAACLVAAPLAAELRFADRAAGWGIDFRHHHGGSGRRYLVETMGGGIVIFDYDDDGDDDLFFVDGGALPGYQGEPARSRLLRNEGGAFRDVTDAARITVGVYGMGGAAADVDGDGDLDLLVTALGPDLLFANQGDGTFTEIAAAAGVADPLWSTSAAFTDADRDGDLDLYVANYVGFTIETHKVCREPAQGFEMYCQPGAYPGAPDRFFRNRGDGTFEEASEAVGLVPIEPMAGLGVVAADLDGNGWPDLYVANDMEPNLLFVNRGDGTYEDRSFISGAALGERGQVEAGMGVDAGDVDGDGLPDLVVTNFEQQTNALYRNLGDGLFVDARYPMGVAESSLMMLAFGVDLAELDNDGDLDLVIANGHVQDRAADVHPLSRFAQPNQVLENVGGLFREVPDAGLDAVRVSRGLATGDLDRDGDLDLVIGNVDDLAEAYENLGGAAAAWLQVDLAARQSAPRGVGARLALAAGGRRQTDEVRSGSSYLSQSASTVHFGLGTASAADWLDIAWPSGRRQRFERLPARRRLRIRE